MNLLQNTIAAKDSFVLTMSDARAEHGERRVLVERERISIARRFKGVAMKLKVPTAAFRGVALSLLPARSGGSFYQVSLVHSDAELNVVLEEAGDDRTIVADWNRWSQYFAITRLVERSPGQFEAMDRKVGALAAGGTCEARRTSLTRQRRGKFLARRKTGEAARRNVHFSNEREIICYE